MCMECEGKEIKKENVESGTKVETKVCKTCGDEKPVNEFQGREIGYYRANCRVCEYIKKNKLVENEMWNMLEYRIIVDNLLNKKIEFLNEILLKLNNKTMNDLLLLLNNKIKIRNLQLKVRKKCLNCDNDVVMKPYEYLNDSRKFCCHQCFVEYDKKIGNIGLKASETMDWFGTKEDFINNYRLLGLKETSNYYNKNGKTITYWADKYNLTRKGVMDNLTQNEVIKIYHMVLEGKLKAGFPNEFTKHKEYIGLVIKELFNNILKWNRDDICNNFISDIFKEYKLDSIINKACSVYENINRAFPEYKIQEWEYRRRVIPYSFWNNERTDNALNWLKQKLIEDKNIYLGSDLDKYNLRELLHEYNLHGLCISNYNYNVEKVFSQIYNEEIHERNEIIYKTCNKCGKMKPYTKEYFPYGHPNNLFRLGTVCKECVEERERKNFYADKNIQYNNETEISSIQWYKYYIDNKITQMPKFCYSKENLSKIIRYLFIDSLQIYNKEDLCKMPTFQVLQEYRIAGQIYFKTKLELLQICFPEYNFIEIDLIIYTDEYCDNIISKWIKEKHISVEQLLENRGLEKLYNHEMKLLSQYRKRNGRLQLDMFLQYFNKFNICNPTTELPITVLDFANKTRGFWSNKENRVEAIRYYCEKQCKESILNNISNFSQLSEWVNKYFRRENLQKLYYFNTFKIKWYDLLIESYPIITKNNLFFQWEWYKNTNTNKQYLVQALREFVLYRANDLIKNIPKDAPKYLNRQHMNMLSPKLTTYINCKIFNSYYEWCSMAFPEYIWDSKDFGLCIAYDDERCGSIQEQMVYEFIKRDLDIKYIKSIAMKRSGKYIFKLDNAEYNKLCPDFVIEYIEKNNKKIKLEKPIIIEYYGLYYPNNSYAMIQNYIKKAKFKNDYYKNVEDIYYVSLYPDDLKNNFQGVREKLTSFFMSNFNIDIYSTINNDKLIKNIININKESIAI